MIIPSIYLSNFEEIYSKLEDISDNINNVNDIIFTSFHIEEEVANIDREQLFNMCKLFKAKGYKIIADVSLKNYEFFGEDFFDVIKENNYVHMFRIDYGFSRQEQIKLAINGAICINGTNFDEDDLIFYKQNEVDVYALHNYYPRPETGLDEDFFESCNDKLKQYGVTPMAFICGDKDFRAPIYDGLPTVESQRYLPPYVSYVLMKLKHNIDNVFIGDGMISDEQSRLINEFESSGVVTIPVKDYSTGFDLYDKVFTIREDSPKTLHRIAESRVFSRKGADVKPFNNIERVKGSITVDNVNYSRYTGEIMLVASDRCADERVNVVGIIKRDYMRLLEVIKRRTKIKFVKGE